MGADKTANGLMGTLLREGGLLRFLSQGVVAQAMVSLGSLAVSVVLIRGASPVEYGYYVLAIAAILVLTTVQNAFLYPPMVLALSRSTEQEQRACLKGTIRLQGRMLVVVATLFSTISAAALGSGVLSAHHWLVIVSAMVAAMVTLYREFLRMVLLARHYPAPVLAADVIYSVVLLAGVALVANSPAAAALSLAALAGGAAVACVLLGRALYARENLMAVEPQKGLLAEFRHIGTWSAVGATTHWSFSQGYNYVAAALLDVTAVAALAATRVTMTPINLLSSSLSSIMLPTASGWLREHDGAVVLRRLLAIACGVATLAVIYLGVLWFAQDWLFKEALGKDFDQRDLLILGWAPVFLVMVFRDQVLLLPGAAGQFRQMAFVTFAAATVALVVTYLAIGQYGVVGSPLGVLCGELINLGGLIWLSWRKIRAGPDSS